MKQHRTVTLSVTPEYKSGISCYSFVRDRSGLDYGAFFRSLIIFFGLSAWNIVVPVTRISTPA